MPGNAEPAPAVAERMPAATPRATLGAPGTAGQPRMLNTPAREDGRPRRPQQRCHCTDRGGATGRFRWPARGRVIAAFGKRPDGTHNDGINIAVPQGTEIHAAESGRVAYAGNELKGYGNLVLIRHDNGWVSAYAHADQILVKRDDVVRRGQVIAKAGKTGTVDQPQLHFELRQGAKPVDPLPHMERIDLSSRAFYHSVGEMPVPVWHLPPEIERLGRQGAVGVGLLLLAGLVSTSSRTLRNSRLISRPGSPI